MKILKQHIFWTVFKYLLAFGLLGYVLYAYWEPASGRAVAWNPAQPIGFDQLATLNGGLGRVLVDAEVAELAWPQVRRLVSPGWVRLEVKASPTPLVAAFRSPDRKRVAAVVINPEKVPRPIEPCLVSEARYRLAEVHVTDRKRQCARVPWTGWVAGESVTTLVYQVASEPER